MDWCEFSLCIWMSAAFIDGNQIFELYFETYKTLKNIINKNVFHEFLKYVKLKKFFQSIWKGNIYKGFQDQFCSNQNNQFYQGKPMVKALLIATYLTSICCVYKEKIVKNDSHRTTYRVSHETWQLVNSLKCLLL